VIQPRGYRVKAHGAIVNDMIDRLNREFPVPKTAALWYIDAEFTTMGQNGPEYGHFVQNPDLPTIFVAVEDRTPAQIAGTIAMQYAFFLQHYFGLPRSVDEAVEFAKYMNGSLPSPPERLAECCKRAREPEFAATFKTAQKKC